MTSPPEFPPAQNPGNPQPWRPILPIEGLVILLVGGLAVAAAIAWPPVGVAVGIGIAVIGALVVLTR